MACLQKLVNCQSTVHWDVSQVLMGIDQEDDWVLIKGQSRISINTQLQMPYVTTHDPIL